MGLLVITNHIEMTTTQRGFDKHRMERVDVLFQCECKVSRCISEIDLCNTIQDVWVDL